MALHGLRKEMFNSEIFYDQKFLIIPAGFGIASFVLVLHEARSSVTARFFLPGSTGIGFARWLSASSGYPEIDVRNG